MRDFDVDALYAALDDKRQAEGLTWQGVARQVNRSSVKTSRAIASSTLTGMRGRSALEGDTVLQHLLWLQRTPESFVPGFTDGGAARFALPPVPAGKIVRFDVQRIYAALDEQRRTRGLTWAQVAKEIGGLHPPALTRYANGGRTGFPDVIRIASWLGCPVASLTRIADR